MTMEYAHLLIQQNLDILVMFIFDRFVFTVTVFAEIFLYCSKIGFFMPKIVIIN